MLATTYTFKCCSAGGAAEAGVALDIFVFPTLTLIPKGAVSFIAKNYALFLLNKNPFLSDGVE